MRALKEWYIIRGWSGQYRVGTSLHSTQMEKFVDLVPRTFADASVLAANLNACAAVMES